MATKISDCKLSFLISLQGTSKKRFIINIEFELMKPITWQLWQRCQFNRIEKNRKKYVMEMYILTYWEERADDRIALRRSWHSRWVFLRGWWQTCCRLAPKQRHESALLFPRCPRESVSLSCGRSRSCTTYPVMRNKWISFDNINYYHTGQKLFLQIQNSKFSLMYVC